MNSRVRAHHCLHCPSARTTHEHAGYAMSVFFVNFGLLCMQDVVMVL